MSKAKSAGARQRRVMYGRAVLTPTYSIDIGLYDCEGVYAFQVVWDPNVPSAAEMEQLHDRVDAALAPYFERAFQLAGLLHGEKP